MTKENFIAFINKHKEILAIAGLLTVCYFLYFFSMGHYPLIDVDETRYAAMSRDMFLRGDLLTLYLNGDFFFEKPPLYFWLETLSFALFGQVNEMTVRMPVAFCASFGVFLTYFLGRKISSKKFGLISALILATSFEFIVLGRVAILDMLLSVCIATSVFAGIYTLFCKESFKKYFWWFSYIFAGFALMAKGIPGVIIPVVTVTLAYIIARKWKEMFKPLYILPGLIFFFIITLPWHFVMLEKYKNLFFHEYIYKHHIERFVNSHELGRKEPFWFFIGVFFVGFIPWIFSFITQIALFFKKSFKSIKDYFLKFNDLQPMGQFLVLNTVFFLVVFLFFSSASTKLPTYILPAMFPASFILGKFWYDFIYKCENERAVNISTLILNFIFLTASIALLIVPNFLPEPVKAGMLKMQIPGFIMLIAFVLTNAFAVFKNKKLLQFSSITGFMILLSMFAAHYIFPFIVSFGENELIKYAKMADKKDAILGSYGFGSRYSLMYYYDDHVYFLGDDIKNETLHFIAKNVPKAYLVVKNKKLDDFSAIYDYTTVESGNKYSLVTDIKTKK